ncbi:sensor histidine kinase [Mesorhizobium erdmanii]|uniref:sensor histidine kinase n=1 Tax=Mesorhizobium erdmanii TaxID=1777866 RepID=UPI0007ECE909|nr:MULTISPECIES: CHASE3 domain-containing protein [Mesorhizobium]OBQ70976.1 hypothetical protein A8146_26280 [Mesorhizobium loti]
MPLSSRSLVRFTSAALLIGFLALTAIVAMNFWLGERAQSYFDDALAARDTRIAAVELRNAMQTAEASQRGFIITGNEIYLAPYQSAKAQAERRLLALETLLPASSDSDATLQRLSTIIASKFDEMDQTVALKRSQRDEDVLAIFRTNKGKALTDEANVFFSGIIVRADDRLTSGVAEQRANTALLRLVSAIGAFVIVAVVSGAAFGVARYTKELRVTRDEVNTLNRNLEQRVATRTIDLAHARDRAEVLLSEVNHRVANSLALVSSLVKLQSKALDDPAAKDALAETQDRIFAISLVHKRLYGSGGVRSVALDEYLSGLLDHLRTSLRGQVHGVNLTYDIDPIELETDTSINLGVVVTELVTNAFKYAYPDAVGEVRVHLRKLADEQAELVVEDDGVGRAEGAPAKGTGVGSGSSMP